MRRRILSRWGIIGSATVVLVAAVLVKVAWAAAINDVYCGLSKDVPQATSHNTLVAAYSCDVPPGSGKFKDMLKITSKMVLPFTPNTACDELGTSGTITTTWTLLLRWGPPDGGIIPFGTHTGSIVWTETLSTGAVDTIKGMMAGTFGCGTHRPPVISCEECRDNLHFEGRLTGTYVSGPTFDTYKALGLPAPTISTTYAGFFSGPLPTPTDPVTTDGVVMTIDGVYSFPCGSPGT
jgi:hypothetical protein